MNMISSNKKILFLIYLLTVIVSMFVLFSALSLFAKDNVYKKIMKHANKYSMHSTFYTDIYYTEPNEDYVETIINCIDFYAPLLYDDFAFENIPKATIIIYENSESMSEALGLNYKISPMGIYYGGVINILSPEQWIEDKQESYIKERFVKEGPLIHEFVHFLTDIKTNGNYSIWFTEGISLYYEYKYAAFEWRQDLKEVSSNITIAELEKNFRNLDESKAYRRSFDIINNYIEKNGEERLQEILAQLYKNKSFL